MAVRNAVRVENSIEVDAARRLLAVAPVILVRATPSIALILMMIVAPRVGRGQPRPLSLEEALRLGAEANPIVRRARADTAVVGAHHVGARIPLPANPWASVLVSFRPEANAQSPQVYAHLEQSFEIAGQLRTRVRAVDSAVRVARLRERFAVGEARARVRGAYAAALLGARMVEEAKVREDVAEQLQQSARARFEAGAASEVDVRLAEAERSKVAAERIAAESVERESLTALRTVVGLPRRIQLVLTSSIPHVVGALAPLEDLIRAAETRRSDLGALRASHTQLDLEIVRLRREAIPNPALFLELWRDFGAVVVGGGVSVQIPVVRRNQGEIAVAGAEREPTLVELAVEQRAVADEVMRAYVAVDAYQREVEIYEARLVPALERQLELVTEGWRAGKFDLFRVATAARELRDAHRTQLQLLGALWQSVIELDRAAGSP